MNEQLRTRAVQGFALLGAQRALSLAIAGTGGILLARLLSPEIFGVYGILTFTIALGVAFGDLGLSAALIQRRELDLRQSLAVAFTAHLSLAIVVSVVILVGAPVVIRWAGLSSDVASALRVVALLIPLAALRMPSAVSLERRLRYVPLAFAESLDGLIFYTVAVLAALRWPSIWSVVLGAVAARVVSVAVLVLAAPWRPTLRWRWSEFSSVLRFGVFFQASAMILLARDSIVPVFITVVNGVAAAGFLNWAAAVAFLPVQIVSIAGRVLFPALSRLQHDPAALARAAEHGLNRVALIVYPAALFLAAAAEPIVRIVYGPQWLAALDAVRLFCVSTLVGGTATILVHTLYSLGRADLVFRLNLLWTVLVWGLTFLLVPRLGYVGFALASALVSLSGMPVTTLAVRRHVPVRLTRAVWVPLCAGTLAAMLLYSLALYWIHDLPSLLVGGSLAALTYLILVSLLAGTAWRGEWWADLRSFARVWS